MERKYMKKLIRKNTRSFPVPNYNFSIEDFGPCELETAEALWLLSNQPPSCCHSLPFSWGSKRRRSAVDCFPSSSYPPPPPSSLRVCPRVPPPSSSSFPPPFTGSGHGKVENQVMGNGRTSSPTSPFSLSPSETEDKLKNGPLSFKKNDLLVKKSKIKKHNKLGELRATVSNLSKQQEELREAVNKVRNYCEEQKRLLVDLQEFKENQIKLLLQTKRVDPNLESNRSNQNHHMEPTTVAPTQRNPQEQQQQQEDDEKRVVLLPLMNSQSQPVNDDRTAMEVEESVLRFEVLEENSECPLGQKLLPQTGAEAVVSGLGWRHHKPLGVDLNVTPEEAFFFQSFDLMSNNKAVACAEARRRRCEINRGKKAMAAAASSVKPRCY